MPEMSMNREKQRELLQLQNTGARAKASLLLLKRAPLLPYRHHRHHPPPPKSPLKAAAATATTPRTTSSTRTEGFVSLAAFGDPLGRSSRRYLRTLQCSEREQKRQRKGKGKRRQKHDEKAMNTSQLIEDYSIDSE
jgi:hypothetical protein